MDVDDGGCDDETGLSGVVQLTKCLLPGNPAIEVTEFCQQDDVQGQWNMQELLKNLFATQAPESIAAPWESKKEVVKEFHRFLWPGFPVPALMKTKHEQKVESDAAQICYLKKKTVPTSVAFAWVLWGISHPRRDLALRIKSWKFFVQLFEHALAEAGRLTFRVKCVGQRGALDKMVAVNIHNPTVFGRIVWTVSVGRQISYQWNVCRLDENNPISSTLERPKLADIICFGLNSANGMAGRLVRPLAHTLMAQFAAWVDEHLAVIALEVQGFHEAKQKNRTAQLDALTHALWRAIDWYLHENELRLLSWTLFSDFFLYAGVYCKVV